MKLAILDDYQKVAIGSANWASLPAEVEVHVFHETLPDFEALVRRLADFDMIVAMRERTPFPAGLLQRLPRLKLLVTTGMRNASIDVAAAHRCGITVCGTASQGFQTAELAFGLILALARHIVAEDRALRRGRWQTTLGLGLRGRVLGIVGLGRLGSEVAAFGKAFQMNVIAWSANLTAERAAEVGVALVSKEELFSRSDFVTIHLVSSERSRGTVGAAEFEAMQPTAFLVNTSRGPVVDETALLDALTHRRIAGAGLDVYDSEPLRPDHPLLALDNVVLTPHLGYVTQENYRAGYGQAIEDIKAFLAGAPVRVISAG